jgi:hypothetical protein
MKVLLIEDNARVAEFVRKGLAKKATASTMPGMAATASSSRSAPIMMRSSSIACCPAGSTVSA